MTSKSIRKVKCPYCDYKNTKEKTIYHISNKHSELLPKGYSASRVLFNSLHRIEHGTCVVCKQPTEWNENTNKYKRLCNNPSCREKLREMYKKNMIKVYGKTTLLNDANQQKKMLANRGISGTYKFENGKQKEYTGSYEKKMIEFLDKVMGFDPNDIIMPGPTLDYEYKGEHHQWITDALIVPYNLIIEVKDGGDNPNKRVMTSYREKQIAKEQMITNMGTYNYLRLTNNQFDQLLEVLYELKMQMINDSEENRKIIIKINENSNLLQEAVLDGIHLNTLNPYEDSFEKELNVKFNTSKNNILLESDSADFRDDIDDFSTLCNQFDSPSDLFFYLHLNHIKYPDIMKDKDKYKNWLLTYPDKLLKNKQGDCWDIALLYHYFCKKKNINCGLGVIQSFFKLKNKWASMGHVFPLFELKKHYYIIPEPADEGVFAGPNIDGLINRYIINRFNTNNDMYRYNENRITVAKYYPADDKIWEVYDYYYYKKITQIDFYTKFHKNDILTQLSDRAEFTPISLIDSIPIDRSIISNIEYNFDKFKYAMSTSIDTFKQIMTAKEDCALKLL